MTPIEVAYNAGVAAAMEKFAAADTGVDVATRMGTGLLGAGLGAGLGGLATAGDDDSARKDLLRYGSTVLGGGLGAYAPNLTAGIGSALAGGALGAYGGEQLGGLLADRFDLDADTAKEWSSRLGLVAGGLGAGRLGHYGMSKLRGE